MNETTRIRRARADDAAGIARVHCASWLTTYAGLVPDTLIAARTSFETRYPLWVKRLATELATVVADDERAGIVGFACVGRMPERPQDREPLSEFEVYLHALYLLAEHQRNGLGRRLMRETVVLCLEAGYTSMALHVLATNPARRFYERLGAHLIRDEPVDDDDPYAVCAYGFADLRAVRDQS